MLPTADIEDIANNTVEADVAPDKDLICYVEANWRPLLRPAPAPRDWMDATAESYAYRCLPLNIANAHGWEVLLPTDIEIKWNGGTGTDALTFRHAPSTAPCMPVSIFG